MLAGCSGWLLTSSGRFLAEHSGRQLTYSGRVLAGCSGRQLTYSGRVLAGCNGWQLTSSVRVLAGCSGRLFTSSERVLAGCISCISCNVFPSQKSTNSERITVIKYNYFFEILESCSKMFFINRLKCTCKFKNTFTVPS